MGQLIEIHQPQKFFTLEEAQTLLPIVKRMTEGAVREVEAMTTQLNYIPQGEKRKEVEKQVELSFQFWVEKMEKIGCSCKGMWLVDFDSGEGYYCWHYPEEKIEYFHGYFDGYQGRIKLHTQNNEPI